MVVRGLLVAPVRAKAPADLLVLPLSLLVVLLVLPVSLLFVVLSEVLV